MTKAASNISEINHFPKPENELARINALHNYGILDSLSEEEFDRIAELASLICDVPISMVSLIDEDRQWFKSAIGVQQKEVFRNLSFCQYTIMDNCIFEIPDALEDERFRESPAVTGAYGIRSYAGYPLVDPDGYAIGTLAVVDPRPKSLNDKQKRSLKLLADEAMALIVARRKKEEATFIDELFNLSDDLICITDVKGIFRKLNPSFEKILGWTPAELLGTSIFDIVHPDDLEATHAQVKLMAEGKPTINFSHRLITSNKQHLYIHWTATPEASTGYLFAIGRNVTEFVRVKEMLEQSNDIAKVGGWEYNFKTDKLHWTSVSKAMRQIDNNAIPGNIISFYKAGEDYTLINEVVEKTLSSGEPFDIEIQVVNSDGDDKWVRAIGRAKMENGKCRRLFGTFQDVNEKKLIELQITSSRKLLDEVLNAPSDVCIIVTDNKGEITVFNKGAEKLLGYTADEIIGKEKVSLFHLPEEVKRVNADFKTQTENDGNIFSQKFRKEGHFQEEFTFVTKTGGHKIVSFMGTAIYDAENQVNGYLGIAIDITEKKAADKALIKEKRRLAAFVEHAPAAVAMYDMDMRLIAVSNKWITDYHLQNQELIGKTQYEIFPSLNEASRARHLRVLGGAVESAAEESYRLLPDQESRYINWEMRPWYQDDEKIGGLMMFTQDITHMVQQREELKIAKKQAEQASVAKSEFLASMSHEIRTPLNGVIGFTDLVLKTRLNETQQQYLSIVNQSAAALLDIINDILDFSKIEAGKLELDIDRLDLHELAFQATDIITYPMQRKGLEMLLNLSPDMPRFIWSDAVRLKQIIINLLGNAAKFTSKGEIELKIDVLESSEGQSTLRVGVRDTGIGIHEDKQDKIFEAFSQEDGSVTKKYGGTGLGLTISNRLLGLMGSKLQLISVPGVGSNFYFDVTFQSEQGEAIVWNNEDTVNKALLVDDNENNRIILGEMLRLKDISSVAVSSGFEALGLLNSGEKYDVILMDYHMPFMDGLETIREIRKGHFTTPKEQPIVLLHSSSDDETLIRACEELQVYHRLVKPVKTQQIFDTLARLHQQVKITEDYTEQKIEATSHAIRILIAEDNPINMLLAKTILKRIAPNATLVEAVNGLEAVARCVEDMPDMVLMDIQMPEMNGYEAAKRIRALEQQHIPIIALTAGNLESEKERCLQAGMDDIILKPFVEKTMALMINQWAFLMS